MDCQKIVQLQVYREDSVSILSTWIVALEYLASFDAKTGAMRSISLSLPIRLIGIFCYSYSFFIATLQHFYLGLCSNCSGSYSINSDQLIPVRCTVSMICNALSTKQASQADKNRLITSAVAFAFGNAVWASGMNTVFLNADVSDTVPIALIVGTYPSPPRPES
jgi:hypothetical protein